jgi:hypothetical protein
VSGHDITKPFWFRGRVNAAVVHGQFTFPGSGPGQAWSSGDLSDLRRAGRVSAITWNLESALHGNREGKQAEVRRGSVLPGEE